MAAFHTVSFDESNGKADGYAERSILSLPSGCRNLVRPA
jgi:hypothetical protein